MVDGKDLKLNARRTLKPSVQSTPPSGRRIYKLQDPSQAPVIVLADVFKRDGDT
jgi:hypothetical protein